LHFNAIIYQYIANYAKKQAIKGFIIYDFFKSYKNVDKVIGFASKNVNTNLSNSLEIK